MLSQAWRGIRFLGRRSPRSIDGAHAERMPDTVAVAYTTLRRASPIERLPESLLDRLEIDSAVEAEISHPPDLLPSTTIEKSVSGHVGEYADWVRGQLSVEKPAGPTEIIWAAKNLHHGRPIAALSLRDRVIYRALVLDITAVAGRQEHSRNEFDAFERSALKHGGHGFVVLADIASYYDYVDHDLLTNRIVDSTGRADTASAIAQFLWDLEGRRIGLPQNVQPSADLADLAIDHLAKRLRRSGIPLYRYNDDFRIGTETEDAATRLIERLQQELHSLGLVLNESKTYVMRREAYSDHLDSFQKRFNEAASEAQLDLTLIDAYTGRVERVPDSYEVDERAAIRVVEQALKYLEDTDDRPGSLIFSVNSQLLRLSTRILSWMRSSAALGLTPHLCAVMPTMFLDVGRYLRTVATRDPERATTAVAEIVERSSDNMSPWQALWLIEALISPATTLTEPVADWLRELAASSTVPDALRARALLAGTIHQVLAREVVVRAIDEVGAAALPDVLAASVYATRKVPKAAILRAVSDLGPSAAWVVNQASENKENFSWL